MFEASDINPLLSHPVRLLKFSLLFSLFFFSCEDNLVIVPDHSTEEVFALKVNESKMLRDNKLTIGFQSVVDDSRCPVDALCFWTGIAQIRLWLLKPGMDSIFVDSQISGYVLQGDTCCHSSRDTVGYRITLLQLDPYPHIDSIMQFSSYQALLKTVRL